MREAQYLAANMNTWFGAEITKLLLCSLLARFSMPIEYTEQLHTRSASEIINAYCHILIFAFYRRCARAYVRYSEATIDAAGASSRLIPIKIIRILLESKHPFKSEQWIWQTNGGRALINTFCHRFMDALFSS
jgi:hypothetical protein